MTATASEATEDRLGLKIAYRLLWLAVIFDILAFGVGFGWDRQWHTTYRFEDFFSPPHLFVYSMHLCATLTLAYIAFTLICGAGSATRSGCRRSSSPFQARSRSPEAASS